MFTKKIIIFNLFKSFSIIFFLIITMTSCDIINHSPDINDKQQKFFDKMIVCQNAGNDFYIVDVNTYEIINKMTISVPDSFQLWGKFLSANSDYLICGGSDLVPHDWLPGYTKAESFYIITYDIANDTIHSRFDTGLEGVGAIQMVPTFDSDNPGSFYLYSHLHGLFAIDFNKQTCHMISKEENRTPKKFHHSADNKWIVMKNYYKTGSYTELEFYSSESGLKSLKFILNENDRDSIDVSYMVFSEDNKYLFFSYLLSNRSAVYEAAFLGSYNLKTKKLTEHHIKLPWSNTPYAIAHSPNRRECYMTGQDDKFYIINTTSENYEIKKIIELKGKHQEESNILINADENIAFVSAWYGNKIYVVDLENLTVINTIDIEKPSLMLPYYD